MNSSEQRVSIRMNRTATLLADAQTFKTAKIDKFCIDPLGQELSELPSINVSGGKLFCKISAFDIKKLAKEKREAGQTLSPDLQQLDEQITEESNPVIIVGNLK